MSLQFHLFGSFEIFCDGKPLPKPATLKSQSLLAYLIVHRRSSQRRDILCNLFWGDRPETRARSSISTALWHIRRCLPQKDLIWKEGEKLQFNPQADIWLDIEEFVSRIATDNLASLSAGVELYRGELLSGFYDDWVVDERYHLEGLYCVALERLMSAFEAQGKLTEALAAAQRLLHSDPLREEAHRLMMRVHHRLGQRNAALKHYQTCREIILSQLGVEPMEETKRLYQAILDERFEWTATPAAPGLEMVSFISSARAGYNPLDATASSPWIGRETQMAQLAKCWEETVAGHGKLIFLGGEAGVGKTRLVQEFVSRLRFQGIRILAGRCYEFERILPYQPIVETLRSSLPALSASEQRLFPHWFVAGETPSAQEEPGKNIQEAAPSLLDQALIFDDVVKFLVELSARGPILLVLEDLQWAAESTLQLLHYLARNLVEHQVMLIGTYRNENIVAIPSLLHLKQVLQKEAVSISIDLPRLSAADVEALIVEMSGGITASAPLARRLFQETEGNPFFLIEMLKALFEANVICVEAGEWTGSLTRVSQEQLPFPQSITDLILARVQNLGADVQNALYLAAVLGREFDFELLNQALGQGHEATLEALDILLRQRLIEEGHGSTSRDYVFVHHKIQEVIYESIPRPRLHLLHNRAALAFEALKPPHDEFPAGELAYHFEECQELDPSFLDRAVKYLLQAGDRARFLYAYQDALNYYQRALRILKKASRHEQAGETLMKIGLTYHTCLDFERSRQAYDEGLSLWRAMGRSQPFQGLPAPHPLRVSWREPNTLDPTRASFEWSSRILDQLFCGLVDITPELDILPDIAHTWDVLEGGRKYIFYLRNDVTWSDGTPVTAHDFEYSWKRALLPTNRFFLAELLEDIKGAKALYQGKTCNPDSVSICASDALTLQVELEEPNGYFLYLVPYLFPIPRHFVETQGDHWSEPDRIVTNGPFLLKKWSPGESIRLSRNPCYHRNFAGNVEQVNLCLLPSMPAQLALYEASELDFFDIWTLPLEERDRARQRNSSDYISLPEVSTLFLGYDVSQAPFDDLRVRRAFGMAIDRQKLANVVMRGCVAPATGGLIPQGMSAHTPGIGLPHDVKAARQLLSEVGGLDFWRDQLCSTDAILPSGSLVPYAHSLRAQWKESLGIDISWQVLDPAVYFDRMQTNPPPMYLMGWMPDCPDPGSLFPSSRIYQYTHWQSDRYDELLKTARQTTDPGARMRLYQEADKLLMQQAVLLPLTYGRTLLLVKPWVKKFSTSLLTRWLWKDVVIEPH